MPNIADQFCSGFIWGFIAAGILGFILQQMRLQMNLISAPWQPQKVSQETKETPAQVVGGGMRGCLGCFFMILILIFILLLLSGNISFGR